MDIRTRLGLFVLVAMWLLFGACATPRTNFPLSKADPEGPTYELFYRWETFGDVACVLPGEKELLVYRRPFDELQRVDAKGHITWRVKVPKSTGELEAIPFENWDGQRCVAVKDGETLAYVEHSIPGLVQFSGCRSDQGFAIVAGPTGPELFAVGMVDNPTVRGDFFDVRRYTLDGQLLWRRPYDNHTFDVQGWTQPDGRVLPVSLFSGLDVIDPDTGEVTASIAPNLGGIFFGINRDPNAKVMFVAPQEGWRTRLGGFDRDGKQLWAAEHVAEGGCCDYTYEVAIEPALNMFAIGYRNPGISVHDLSTGVMLVQGVSRGRARPYWLRGENDEPILVVKSYGTLQAFVLVRTPRSVKLVGDAAADKTR